jgi:hypothetical protein
MFKITLGKRCSTKIIQLAKFKLNNFYEKADEKNRKVNNNMDSPPKTAKSKDYNKPQFYNYKPSKKHIERGLNYQKEDNEAFRQIQEKQKNLETIKPVLQVVSEEKNFKSKYILYARSY